MSTGYEADLADAKKTLNECAGPVSRMFARKVGMLRPRQSGFVESVFDHKYWFARLYETITYYEIGAHDKFNYPGFVMHFIPVFYGMYYDALQSFLAGKYGPVSSLWMTHFNGRSGHPSPTSLSMLMFSVVTGTTAHVQGDMANALEQAYRSWTADPKPAFSALYDDFFVKDKPIFAVAKAEFFLDVGRMTQSAVEPEVAQLIIGVGEQVTGGGLDMDDVQAWRKAAWKTAEGRLASPTTRVDTAVPNQGVRRAS